MIKKTIFLSVFLLGATSCRENYNNNNWQGSRNDSNRRQVTNGNWTSSSDYWNWKELNYLASEITNIYKQPNKSELDRKRLKQMYTLSQNFYDNLCYQNNSTVWAETCNVTYLEKLNKMVNS